MKRWSRFTLVLMVILLTVFLQGCNSAPAPQTLGNEQRMVIRVATDYRMDSIGISSCRNLENACRRNPKIQSL